MKIVKKEEEEEEQSFTSAEQQQQAQSLLQQRQWPLPLVNVNENHFIDDLYDFVEEEEERRLARENQRRVVVKAEAEEEEEEVPREEAGPSPSGKCCVLLFTFPFPKNYKHFTNLWFTVFVLFFI